MKDFVNWLQERGWLKHLEAWPKIEISKMTISLAFYGNDYCALWSKFRCNLIWPINLHIPRRLLGAEKTTSYNSNQYWPQFLTHFNITTPRYIIVGEINLPDVRLMHNLLDSIFLMQTQRYLALNINPSHLTHSPSAAYMRRWTGSSLVQIMAWRRPKPLSQSMPDYR